MGEKSYIGDGTYAAIENGQLVLTTSNGLRDTNTIYLEPETWVALTLFVERNIAAEREAKAPVLSESADK